MGGFRRTTEASAAEKLQDDENLEDAPSVPMILQCGAITKDVNAENNLLPLEPCCPIRADHFEDGPTWLPVASLLAQSERKSPEEAFQRFQQVPQVSAWMSPAPLEGVKSRFRAVYSVNEVTVDAGRVVGLKLMMASRVA